MKNLFFAAIVLMVAVVSGVASAQEARTQLFREVAEGKWEDLRKQVHPTQWTEEGSLSRDFFTAVAWVNAKSQGLVDGSTDPKLFVAEFWRANSTLDRLTANGSVAEQDFITLAKGAGIWVPNMVAASAPESVPTPAPEPVAVSTAPQEIADEVARDAADAALQASKEALAAATAAATEVEKLASRPSVDTVARGRLTALEQQSTALAALPEQLRESQEAAIVGLMQKQQASEEQLAAQTATFKEEVDDQLAATNAKIAELAATPASDVVARSVGGVAVVFVAILLFVFVRTRSKIGNELKAVVSEQEAQHKQLEGMETLVVEVSYDRNFIASASGAEAVVRVKGKEFRITLKDTKVPGMVMVQGIQDQTKPVRLDRLERVCRNAYASGRLLNPLPTAVKIAAVA